MPTGQAEQAVRSGVELDQARRSREQIETSDGERSTVAEDRPPSLAADSPMRPNGNSLPQAGCIQAAFVGYQPQWSGDAQSCLIPTDTAPS